MRSIIQKPKYRLDKRCFWCDYKYGVGTWTGLECHHIFGGANRPHSERLGLTVYLCHKHHNEPGTGVHFRKDIMEELHRIGQRAYESEDWKKHPSVGEKYGKYRIGTREAFREEFGKNYLGDEEIWEDEKSQTVNPEQFMFPIQ